MVEILMANMGDIRDTGLNSGFGISPEGGHTNLLQYSSLKNPMKRGAFRLQSIASLRDLTEATYNACTENLSYKTSTLVNAVLSASVDSIK